MASLIIPLLAASLMGIVAGQWRMIWQDNFNTLDAAKWEHEITAWGGGNKEFQFYSNDPVNSYVRNGILYMKPTLTVNNKNPLTGRPFGYSFLERGTLDVKGMYGKCTMYEQSGGYRRGPQIPPVMSARLRTAQRFSFKYGKVEVRAKMSKGDWLWPAFWMLPEKWEYGGWPASGEIDIVEVIGNPDLKSGDDGHSMGMDKMASTIFFGPVWNDAKSVSQGKHDTSRNYGENFHTYTLEWEASHLRFLVDGVELMQIPKRDSNWRGFWEKFQPWRSGRPNPWLAGTLLAPFDKEFHLVMNVAVGGNGPFPDNAINRGGRAPKPWRNGAQDAMQTFWAARNAWYPTWNGEDAAMQVDWVRVYKRR